MTTLDCSDPRAEATFWSELLGWEVAAAEDEYAMLVPPGGGAALGFGAVPDYEPPAWPNERGSKQFHFDLGLQRHRGHRTASGRARARRVPDDQPGDTWRVLLDPAGHPFCLTDAARW